MLSIRSRLGQDSADARWLFYRDRHDVADIASAMFVARHNNTEIVEWLAVALIRDQRRLATEFRSDLAGRADDHIAVFGRDADRMAQLGAFTGIVEPAGSADQQP